MISGSYLDRYTVPAVRSGAFYVRYRFQRLCVVLRDVVSYCQLFDDWFLGDWTKLEISETSCYEIQLISNTVYGVLASIDNGNPGADPGFGNGGGDF